jgi:cytochrome c553
MLSLPGSTKQYTAAQVRNGFDIADWRPDLHGAMPDIVAKGRQPDVRACGFCHLANGQGRPENAGLAGQPMDYIIQQVKDMKADLRVSSDSRLGPQRTMVAIAKAATDEEVRTAAQYFQATPFRQWIRVVESATVPTPAVVGGMYQPAPAGGTEPLGARIIEMPEDVSRVELRDPASGFVAYVPVGSVAKGKALVTTGGGKTMACISCHGPELKGGGTFPAIAGRSPTYMARQLYDFQSGARKGANAPMMKAVVQSLTPEDILNIVAYTASLKP